LKPLLLTFAVLAIVGGREAAPMTYTFTAIRHPGLARRCILLSAASSGSRSAARRLSLALRRSQSGLPGISAWTASGWHGMQAHAAFKFSDTGGPHVR